MSKTELNELASAIGRECERLIGFLGGENVNEMVTKCIQALELVEVLINEKDTLREEVKELQEKIFDLENMRMIKNQNQKAFEKDIETMEDLWNSELTTLQQKVKQLDIENQKLIAKHKKFKITSLDNLAGSLYVEEYKLNEDLKDHVTRLQVELKLKEKELEGKNSEIQHLSEEVEFLRIEQNQMRRRSRVMETQVKSLYEEREEILADMKEKSFLILRDHLGMAQLENEDLAWRQLNDPLRPRFTLNEMNSLLEERNVLAKRVDELEEELVGYKMEKLIENSLKSRRSEERVVVEVKKPSIWTNLWSKFSTPFKTSNHDWTVDELLKLSSTTGYLHRTPI